MRLALPLLLLVMTNLSPAQTATPPVAKKEPKTTEINGHTLTDNYYWLRDKPNPEVRAYLEAENVYTDSVMKPTEPLQKKLYDEMLGRIKETDVDVPYPQDGYFYYSRTEAGKQYAIRCRKKGSLDAPEQVVIDVNELAKGKKFMSLAEFEPSDDGNLLAYSTDSTGFRQYDLYVRDMRTGQDLPDHIAKTGSIAWANDNKTIFYTVEDSAKRQYRVYKHTVGNTGADDLIYEEKDERYDVYVWKSRSKGYIFLSSASHTTSEAKYIRADQPNAEWKLIEPRKQDVKYTPDHNGKFFYLTVNDTGVNYRLVKTPVDNPGKAHWQEVIPQRAETMLNRAEFFKDFYVLHTREKGLPLLRVVDITSGKSKDITFPEPAYNTMSYMNADYDTKKFRYMYTSFITPVSTYEYDVTTGESKLLKQREVPNYDGTKYKVEQLYAPARDGEKVPVSVLYAKTTKLDGKEPLYLYAYGSYGASIDINFNSNFFSLADRGVVVAIAHIRGGGEMGKAWHNAGRMMNKKNTFNDFIDSAEYLLKNNYGTKDKLVIEGRSAGGLLMGAVLNMRPDLFHAAIVGVPFVDVINTMLDESLPLTVGEFEEWGNPKEKAAFDYMYSYSPYDNIDAKPYPNMLVKTSFNDSQVMYWEPAKYVAKMRALRKDDHLVILKTNLSPAGHGGSSGRYDRIHEFAFDYAFILTQMGINE
ncbi:oligopeptidase B [Candidatus Koribacter versatilis Ellin345]|uniref:Oligopeptidase B n=1 Tax=Koribacter versatilis (strain Ellin345) TaxID=204669 RepID=Q1IP71_KORVE|nr:oligopeptidase B [Candidatus Koribacter versatilis]ABF41329.1 oligopeptidase B [Candidatus Koribacter versatilis Ellin345]